MYLTPKPPSKAIRGLAISQLVLGSLLLVMEATTFGLWMNWAYYRPVSYNSIAGMIASLLLVASGGCGVAATQVSTAINRRQCNVIAFLVLSTLSSIYAVPMVVLEALEATDAGYYFIVMMGLRIATAFLFLVVFVTTIVGSAFSCANLCCGSPSYDQLHQTAIVTNYPQPPMVIYPQIPLKV